MSNRVDCIRESCLCNYYRWRLRWTEPDVINHRRTRRVFLGRLFRSVKDKAFEFTIFKHDVKTNLKFII